MSKPRIQIWHTHVLVRQMLSDVINSSGEYVIDKMAPIELIETESILKEPPDILLIDVNDEHRLGLQMIRKLHELNDSIRILALSKRTRSGARDAIEALQTGALDYITITERPGMLLFAEDHLQKRLLPILDTVKDLPRSVTVHIKRKGPTVRGRVVPHEKPEVLVIGGCIGAPIQLMEVVQQITATFPTPILVTLHMPKIFTEVFAQLLNMMTDLEVKLAKEGDLIQVGNIYIAPGGYHMMMKGPKEHATIHIHRGSHENRCRPSIDALFRSAADVYGPHVAAIVLSGKGKDGVHGARQIAAMGGVVLLSDPTDIIAPDIVEHIIKSGINYQITPTNDLIPSLLRLIHTIDYPVQNGSYDPNELSNVD